MMVKVREVKKELVCQHINESLPPNLQNAASIPLYFCKGKSAESNTASTGLASNLSEADHGKPLRVCSGWVLLAMAWNAYKNE